MYVGAHVSASGGLGKAIDRAKEIGAECIQLFCSSPQGWAFKPISQEQSYSFRQKAKEAGIGHVFLHGIYLVNLGSQDSQAIDRGIQSLINYMQVAHEIGATGVVFHAGSHKGVGFEGVLGQTAEAMRRVLESSHADTLLIVENSAGMGNHIGASFTELGRILRETGHPQVRVCLDTQHCFAAGYDIAHRDGIKVAMEEFDREVGLHNLVAVHANDSKGPLGSGVDRHENIGHGAIGLEGFRVIMGHPAFRHLPFLLEVPGIDGNGPDKPNVDILKDLRAQAGLTS